MAGFVWNAFRLARLRSAVRAYNAAITRKTKELEGMGVAEYANYLPPKVTVAGIKERIYNVNDFRRIVGYKNDIAHHRYSELSRVLKSVNPEALNIVLDKAGNLTTNYELRQFELDKRAIRRMRERTLRDMTSTLYDGDIAYDLDSMTPPERATVTTNNDLIVDDEGELDSSTEDEIDPETLAKWRREDAKNKRRQVAPDAMFEVYMDVWKNPLNFHAAMSGYRDLIEAMEWLLENRIDVLNKMFAEGRDELDPQYITESGGASNPYVNIPYETRHNRAVRFVVNKARAAGYEG